MKLQRNSMMLTTVIVSVGIASAQLGGVFGGGIPVFDGSNLVETVLSKLELVKQVKEAIETTKKLTEQYDHMQRMAKHIKDMGRYKTPTTFWHGLESTNMTGFNTRWLNAANGGIDAFTGWADTIQTGIGSLPGGLAGMREQLKKQTAAIEVMDGTGITTLETMGHIRSHGVQSETMLERLEADSLADNLELQTEAAQMNKSNAIAMVQARQLSDLNKLLVSNTEISLLEMRERRDAAMTALLAERYMQTEGRAMLEASRGGGSEAMMNFRLGGR